MAQDPSQLSTSWLKGWSRHFEIRSYVLQAHESAECHFQQVKVLLADPCDAKRGFAERVLYTRCTAKCYTRDQLENLQWILISSALSGARIPLSFCYLMKRSASPVDGGKRLFHYPPFTSSLSFSTSFVRKKSLRPRLQCRYRLVKTQVQWSAS